VLGAVPHEQTDTVARADTSVGQTVGQAGRAFVEQPVRQTAVAADQRLTIREAIDDFFEPVGDVEASYVSSLSWRR
jgi:hypothetical protein